MLQSLIKGAVPKIWMSEYLIWKSISVSLWIADLAKRVRSLEKYKVFVSDPLPSKFSGSYWLGGLFYPEAFITATRQIVAQVNFIIKLP